MNNCGEKHSKVHEANFWKSPQISSPQYFLSAIYFSARAAPPCKVCFRASKGVWSRVRLSKTSISVKSCCLWSRIMYFFLPAHSSPAASPSLLFRIWPLHDIRHFRQEGGLETPGLPSSLIYPVALCQTPQEKCWLEAKLALKLALLFVVASTWSLCGISVAKITRSVRLGG